MIVKAEYYKKMLIALAGIVCSLVLTQCKPSGEKEEQKESGAPAIEVFPLKQGRLTASLKIPGELMSFRDVDLYAKISSFAKQLYVDVGSEVKEGQLLALMEAPEI